MYRYHQQEGLEPVPSYSLQTADQEEGVDYSAFGFMFDVHARDAPLVVTGLQVGSGFRVQGSGFRSPATPWSNPSLVLATPPPSRSPPTRPCVPRAPPPCSQKVPLVCYGCPGLCTYEARRFYLTQCID